MYTGYLSYRGVEIGNSERVLAYLQGNPLAGIPGLKHPNTVISPDCGCLNARCLYCDPGTGEDLAFTSPKLDDAPWYDPDVPESEEFAGFFIEDITGFDSVVRRDFSSGAISGGSLGPLRLGGRCMTVTGWLRAKTCCAAEYGLRWLTEALIGGTQCDDCAYGDLYMIKCCPPMSDDCHTVVASTSETAPAVQVDFTLTDNGDSTYTIILDDPSQANLISDPAGAANNTDGAVAACNAAGNSPRFVLVDVDGALFTFLLPFEAVTSFVTAASGGGASATIEIDTTVEGSCDDIPRDIERFVSQANEYLGTHASGVLVAMTSPTEVQCQETRAGFNPADYIRLLHRVGLTEGPTVIDRRGTCCQSDCGCVNIQVEFTLCSELPYIFSDIEWCAEEEAFDTEDCYCLDLRDICDNCSTQDATKFVERETRRPPCNITIRHDGTWCPEGWLESEEGCPPTQCLLTVTSVEEFTPEEDETITGSSQNNQLFITLHDDGTWSPDNFEPSQGMPPSYAEVLLSNGGDCERFEAIDPYCESAGASDCTFEVAVDPSPAFTWTPVGWSPEDNGFPPQPCQVEVTPGVCICPQTAEAPEGATVFGDGTWFDAATCTFGCEPCGDCDICADTTGGVTELVKCPIKLIWNKATGAYTFEALTTISGSGGQTGYGDCDCFEVVDYCIEGVEPCLVRVIYDEGTGEQTWEPIRWSGTIPTPSDCDCIQIAEIVIRNSVDSACADETECPISIQCGPTYRPSIAATRGMVAAFFYRYNGSPAFVPPTTPSFPDLLTSHQFYLELEWAISVGLITGYADGKLRPDNGTTRQAMAVFFYRDAGSPPFVPPGSPTFSDVPTTHAFYTEIEWAADQGIFVGFSDGTFRPNNIVSRRSAGVLFYRYAGSPPFVPPINPSFFDVAATDVNYIEIEWMFSEGITLGYPNSGIWSPIGWDYDPFGEFPPENCNFFIETVNGTPIDTSPITTLVEVPYDEFVPDCGPFPVPPPPPVSLSTECYCEPWVQTRKCCTFTNPGDWNEATSYIEIWTGSDDLRNMKISAYQNPFGDKVPCPCDPADPFWDCREPCSTILVPQLPPRSKLIIDSRTRTAELILHSGRTVNALRYVYAANGKPFEWFDIGPCSTFCVVVQADCNSVAEDATVSIGAVGRYLASGW